MRLRMRLATLAAICLAFAVPSRDLAAGTGSAPAAPPVMRHQEPPAPGTAAAAVSASEAKALFERLKRLQGKWRGSSTKGWQEAVSIQVIAGSSAIVFDSFDAHPNEKMLTLIHLDRDRLLLTHYCVAGNQPRLQAISIADGGSRVSFAFLDATNLPSRDTGHMDSVKFVFRDENHFTEQWSWYQKGQERWMETIEMERMPDLPAAF